MDLRSDEKGAEAPRSVLVREHEGEDGCGRVAGTDVQFHGVLLAVDDDLKSDLIGIARCGIILDGELCHRGDVVTDTG